MNVGRCLPHMWGFIWGYAETLASVPGKQKPCPTSISAHVALEVQQRACEYSFMSFSPQTRHEPAFHSLLGRVKCSACKWLYQAQFNCPFDSPPAILDIEFIVDALGVCADRAQSDHEFTGDLGSRKLGLE